MNLNSINSRFLVPLGGAIALALFAALPARADYQSTVLDQNPVGYWRLNETTLPPVVTTTANKGSLGSSANGTYNNDPTRALPGPFAGSVAIGLDGSSQSVTTPWQGALNSNTFSVELWVNPAQVPKFGYVASSVVVASPRSGWYLAQDDGNTFGHGSAFVVRLFYTNSTTPSTTLWAPMDTAGVWYHLVLTYDSSANLATLYTNGAVAMTTTPALNGGGLGFVGNVGAQTSFGMRSEGSATTPSIPWPGQQAEPAMYGSALSAAQVAAHYTAGTTAPATYVATVQADSPVLWYRYQEPADVIASNISSAGSSLNGQYQYGTTPGAAGPRSPTYIGFDTSNDAVSVPGTGPSVSVPALNLNTNTVTITGWINPSGNTESQLDGIIMCDAGSTYSGLNMDLNGTGVGYTWANDGNTYNWIPSTDANPPLPQLSPSGWSYVALVVKPDQAAIYLCASNNPATFAGATNFPPLGHAIQAFDGSTLFGSDAGSSTASFNGLIDEVAIFNRALGVGELYTQYGAAVGGLKPIIFGDLQGPTDPVAVGDPIILSVDAGGTPPLTFTWHARGGTIVSTSSNTLVIANSSLTDSGTYDVTITNASGSAQSASVTVSVVVPSQPAIVQLMGYQSRTLYPTGTLSMAVSATGGGLKYQWYKDTAPIASATSSAFTIPHVVTGDAGGYSVSITNIAGNTTSGPPAVITIRSVATGSYEAAIVSSGPEAWWRMDEATGSTTMWDSMGRHDGYYTNLAGTTPPVTLGATGALVGDTNTAATFVAANQAFGYVPISPALNPKVITIECWVKTASATVNGLAPVSSHVVGAGWWWQTDVEAGTGYWIPDGSDAAHDAWRTPLEGTADAATAAIVPGQWSHLVLIVDTTSGYPITPYINGVGFGSWGFNAIGNFNGSGPFLIGARGNSPTAIADTFFDGQVDEVAVYNYALTAAEITNHFIARGIVLIPVTYTTPLLSQTVTAGKSISFSTSVLGTGPISLQWYKDTKPIKDATNSTYAIASTALGDTGTYTLWGTNSVSTNSTSASVVVISPVGYANVTNNLVLHLTFDGDTLDSSGRGNDGIPSTTTPPTFVPGIIGTQALHYATVVVTNVGVSTNIESTSYVTVGAVGSGPPADLRFDTTTSFSVSLWVKLDVGAIPGDMPFIGTATNSNSNPGWDLSPSFQTGGWQWDLNDGVNNPGNNVNVSGPDGSLNDGNWHNFVLTVDRTAQVADSYLDGVHTASSGIASLGNLDNNNYWPIVIGQDPTYAYHQTTYGPFAISATVDDIGIWRQALTALDVAQIASAGSTAGRSFNTVGPATPTQPDITGISVSGGTVTIKFTGAASDPATAFTLWSSSAVKGIYGSTAGASITGSAGSYTATAPTSGAMQFYRIQR